MHLEPTPLPPALNHILESITRVSALVQPAFGLAPPSQPHHHHHHHHNRQQQGEQGQADTPPTNISPDGVANPNSRQERGHKRVVRVRYDLNHARSLVEQLRGLFCDDDAGAGGRWKGIERGRKGLVEMRQVAAVLGAGALVLYCLEGALVELGRLYEVEEGIRRGVGVGVGVGVSRGPEGKEREEREERERDVDVVRWMRHERRGEVWDLMKGVKDFGTAVWFFLTIFESPSPDEAATGRANLVTAVADIMVKDNALSKTIHILYPDLNPRLSSLETAGISTMGGSSLGVDTLRSSGDAVVFGSATPSDKANITYDIDDSGDSDSDSEPGIDTPTSSVFPISEPDEEGPELGYQLTLAAILNPSVVRVPVAMSVNPHPYKARPWRITNEHPPSSLNLSSLRVLTVSTAGIDISPLPEDIHTSLPPSAPNKTLSADAVFQLPDITDEIVLDFFRRALHVSRFAARFENGKFPYTGCGGRSTEEEDKLGGLLPRQLRELCTDLYDELVRRNVEDQNKGQRESADRAQFVEPEGFNAKRRRAREKLADMEDEHLVKFIALALRELDRRCGANEYDASRAAECRAVAALRLEGASRDEAEDLQG
ncbi:predicted protein [Chaetomium globosum CBS 148.51]|uniref:GIT Spa2 homology (SHD) domain-containing protein n=1 Tax=Chaetomium globosum (strain ATCC 6205 / CBS 148.51 / DSM 1962 / NBRC 6347 / NRRL 1970) TaxID=306901 RepID=Q2H7N6_CHAGB|nr:uncharacterized protein CHGG_05329 [Chaetomium globosum CBS 148.51]EAQ88710.1 predicted protein [Chaetomium globosum CBS 148.51]